MRHFGGWTRENEKHKKVHDYHDYCLELALLFFPLQISLGSPTVLSTDYLERQMHGVPVFLLDSESEMACFHLHVPPFLLPVTHLTKTLCTRLPQ